MNGIKENITQTELFAKELQRLKPDITKNDKDVVMKELGINSKSTISLYLNGKVMDLDTAAALIAMFKTLIAERSKVLAN